MLSRKQWFNLLTIMILFFASGVTVGIRHEGVSPALVAADTLVTAAANGTAFTYQGRLNDGGSPANGVYDFQFSLYDALAGGNQVGSTVVQDDVTISDGLFTASLDFGAVFGGTAVYLEIGVRPGSGGSYTTLSPRQAVTPTPYALFAEKVRPYENMVVVAKSGGDFTGIQAALDSITDASDSNRYLVWIAPGRYSERVTMKPYVDIEGAGEATTKITTTGSPNIDTGTIIGADNAELRFVTVESSGKDARAIAIYNDGVSPALTHVTAVAFEGTTTDIAILNRNSAAPVMTHITAVASTGTSTNAGVSNWNAAAPTMTNINASASGGTNSYGIQNESASPVMTNIVAKAAGDTNSYGVHNDASTLPTMTNVRTTATGGNTSYGLYNDGVSSMIVDVVASAADAASGNYGVYNLHASPTFINLTASATGGTTSYGMYNYGNSGPTIQNSVIDGGIYGVFNYALSGGPSTVTINNTQITGSSSTVRNDAEFTTLVGGSLLAGGGVGFYGGTITCAGVFDEGYTFYSNTCP